MFMHTDTHSPLTLPFPHSTMKQTQRPAGLTHEGEGQTGNHREGC